MIDLHAHVLPGVDDGPRTLDESMVMLATAAAQGVTAVAATPHVRHDYQTTAAVMRQMTHVVRNELERRAIPIELLTGGELDYEWLEALTHDEARAFGLGGNPRFLLVEVPYSVWPLGLPSLLRRLLESGITPVLAHPERNPTVQERPELLAPLVDDGVLVQLTVSSLVGGFGRLPQRAAEQLLDAELAHLAASDMHSPLPSRSGLAGLTTALRSPALARWLAQEVPAAIVGDHPLPRRPPREERRSRLAFWLRNR